MWKNPTKINTWAFHDKTMNTVFDLPLICILSRLDYWNDHLADCPTRLPITKLQTVKNNSARLVNRSSKFDHVTPLLALATHQKKEKNRVQTFIALFQISAMFSPPQIYLRSSSSLHAFSSPLLIFWRKTFSNTFPPHKNSWTKTFCLSSSFSLEQFTVRHAASLQSFKPSMTSALFLYLLWQS